MSRIGGWALLVGLLCGTTLAGEEGTVLTLDECTRIALEQNLGLRRERLSLAQVMEDLQLARADRYLPRAWSDLTAPAFREEIVQDFDPETGLDRFVPSRSTRFQGGATMALPVWTGGEFRLSYDAFRLDQGLEGAETTTFGNTARLAFDQPLLGDNQAGLVETMARSSLAISEETLRRRVVELTYRVAEAYYGLVRAVRRLEIGQRRLEQSATSHEIARKKLAAGLIPEVEALQLEVELARSRAERERLFSVLRRSEDQLRMVLGWSLDEDLAVETDITPGGREIDIGDAVEQALLRRSELRERELQLERARLELRSLKRTDNLSGRLSLFYEYDGRDETYRASVEEWRQNQGAELSLRWPIMDSGRTAARVRRQKWALERLELDREELRRQIRLEVREAVRSVQEAQTRVEILEASQRVAQRTYEISRQRFEAGNLTSQELFTEEVRLHETRMDHLDALIDQNLAWARFLKVVNQ